MPFFSITTNKALEAPHRAELARTASRWIAETLGKPESYVMVQIDAERELILAGSDAPTCFVSLKSLGLPHDKTEKLSQDVCDFIHREIGIAPDRVYIEFSSPERHMWGFNRKTFGS